MFIPSPRVALPVASGSVAKSGTILDPVRAEKSARVSPKYAENSAADSAIRSEFTIDTLIWERENIFSQEERENSPFLSTSDL